jgi:hypothetical protein
VKVWVVLGGEDYSHDDVLAVVESEQAAEAAVEFFKKKGLEKDWDNYSRVYYVEVEVGKSYMEHRIYEVTKTSVNLKHASIDCSCEDRSLPSPNEECSFIWELEEGD